MPTTDRSNLLIPVIALLAAMCSIQTGASFAKQLFPVLGASGTACLRLCFAAAILAAICRPWRLPMRRDVLQPVICYGLSMGCMNLLIYLSLEHIPLGIAVALEFMGPLAVAVYTSQRRLDYAWVVCALLGIALLLPPPDSGHMQWIGFAYALGAGLCWALYIIYGQRAGKTLSGGLATSAGMVVATMAIAPIGIAQAGSVLLHLPVWPAALAVAILSSALPYYLEMVALKSLPAKTFGIFMSMEPAIAALSGLLILQEQLSPSQWTGIACVMLASAGAIVTGRKPLTTPELTT